MSLTGAGEERWVYRYDGPTNNWDEAYSVVIGSDSNVYAAGCSEGTGSSYDFTVVSLSGSGEGRWVYRYDGPQSSIDCASSIAEASDGNVYAAGWSVGSGTWYDLTVVSLTNSGAERWIYRYNGPADYWDRGHSIIAGSDGNLYCAGYSTGTGTSSDFTVVSLTTSGEERWVYRYDGPANAGDVANSIVMGPDGNLYAAGSSCGSGTSEDFTVVSLTTSGDERWVYRYDGPGAREDRAYSIATSWGGGIYAAGYGTKSNGYAELTVVSLSPDVGVEEVPDCSSVTKFRLPQNSPNPFHRSTRISYSLPAHTQAILSIYDITGRLVETLVNETQEPGIRQVSWDRKQNPSGVYFYRLKAGESVETRKMVVVD